MITVRSPLLYGFDAKTTMLLGLVGTAYGQEPRATFIANRSIAGTERIVAYPKDGYRAFIGTKELAILFWLDMSNWLADDVISAATCSITEITEDGEETDVTSVFLVGQSLTDKTIQFLLGNRNATKDAHYLIEWSVTLSGESIAQVQCDLIYCPA